MFSWLYNWYYGINYGFNFKQFNNILEYIPNINVQIKDQIIDINETLITYIYDQTKDYIINNRIIVSLSGGVDSMVLITILKLLDIDVIAVHIDYNNRSESKYEKQFLEKWCQYNNIKFYCYTIDNIKRNNTKRTQYELLAKQYRFKFYQEIMDKEKLDCVLLAHHKDDVVENIVANVCRGRNILDLAVIRYSANINNVNIVRPMIELYKSSIYIFADTYQVPYFKDTTPSWSVRGKYRNTVEPVLIDTFSDNVKQNLLTLSRQADDWNSLISKTIIKPFIDNVRFDDKQTQFNIKEYRDYPHAFWNRVFTIIFNRYNMATPGTRAISSFMNSISNTNVCYISLANCCKCRNVNDKITITFK